MWRASMTKTIAISEQITGYAGVENKGLDYVYLKNEGVGIVQQLSGDVWTDYNEHDPGVTTLEQVCYALTDLSYRAELPLTDLLTDQKTGKINPQQQALFEPELMLPCAPVTIDDYRRLIVDRIPQISNIWLNPITDGKVNGLYQVYLYVPDIDECACDDKNDLGLIKQAVIKLYNQHRALCENIAKLNYLTPRVTRVTAKVVLNDDAMPVATLAQVLFRLSLLFAPEVQRSSLQSWLDRGLSSTDIFQGPLLLNGLIDKEQLQPKPSCISVIEATQTMVNVNGVSSVYGLCITLNESVYKGNQIIEIKEDEILQLDLSQPLNFPICLYQNGAEVAVNMKEVFQALAKMQQQYRRSSPLKQEYQQAFAFPQGQVQDLSAYYSIQNQFPGIYGINDAGVAGDQPPIRHAQAKQFKGYLLVFEQLLANYLAQLAHVKDLYSTDADLSQSYFYQSIASAVPNVGPLLEQGANSVDYLQGLAQIVQSQDPFELRRNRFLDFLLALYGQNLTDEVMIGVKDPQQQMIQAKIKLLHHLVRGTCDRGQGIDYRASFSKHNIAGMEIKLRIELGMAVFDRQLLLLVCAELGVSIVSSDQQGGQFQAQGQTIGKLLLPLSDDISEVFSSLSQVEEQQSTEKSQTSDLGLNQEQGVLQGQKLTSEFIETAANIKNYYIARYANQSSQQKVALICKNATNDPQPSTSDWLFIKNFSDDKQAQAAVNQLTAQAQQLHRSCQQLYIIEHILLRVALGHGKHESDFSYSFTITAVIAVSSDKQEKQTRICELIRQNTPSMIKLNYCFLSTKQLFEFELLYWTWRRELKNNHLAARIKSCVKLRDYLQAHLYVSGAVI
jgi:hypothetical protein